METMSRVPADWRGSDLRSRREVVQYLAARGGELEDKSGLIVGKMREDLGRGRALAQLLTDMEKDGMLDREVRGRRTFRIKLLDDWGLVEPEPAGLHAVTGDGTAEMLDEVANVDLTALAETLLAVVVKRMTTAAEAEGGPSVRELSDRLRRAERELQQTQGKLRDKSEEATTLKAERDEARQQVRTYANNVEVLQGEVRKLGARQKRTGGAPVGELIGEDGRKALEQLMKALPESPVSKPRAAGGSK